MDLMLLAYAVVVVFLAAIVRGFSGFGFSLLTITALAIAFTPAEIIPSIFLLEVAASIHLLPSIWRQVHWRSLAPLTIGSLISTPFGVWLLASIPAAPMQFAMAIFVFVSVILMWRGFALKTMPDTLASTAAGAASGLANGAFGIGGPPVVLFYFASPAGNAAGRASLIAFFLVTDAFSLVNQSFHGLINRETIIRAAVFLPVLLAGVWVGSHAFKSIDPQKFRKFILALLGLMAIMLAAKAIVQQ